MEQAEEDTLNRIPLHQPRISKSRHHWLGLIFQGGQDYRSRKWYATTLGCQAGTLELILGSTHLVPVL